MGAAPQEDNGIFVETNEPDAIEMVRVLSSRPGDIILQDGQRLKSGTVLLVTLEVAAWLEASFGEFITLVD